MIASSNRPLREIHPPPLPAHRWYDAFRRSLLPSDDQHLSDGVNHPPERWLQQAWRHQRVRPEQLRLADGRSVRIWHPGFWNREPGPDFRRAVIQIADGEPVAGDIELDLDSAGWRHHGHGINPSFGKVVLHVVWNTPPAITELPTLWLAPILDEPIETMSDWLQNEAQGRLPRNVPGECSHPMKVLSRDQVESVLRQAAEVRLNHKAVEIGVRAKQAGWEQSLREHLVGALGYKHNVWPMRRVAEAAWRDPIPPDSMAAQARCLGLAGLLPAHANPTGQSSRLRTLWDYWWRERNQLEDFIVPPTMWHRGGHRPLNHPQRRLALASRWLIIPQLCEQFVGWVASELSPAEATRSLTRILLAGNPDPFWSTHWTLTGRDFLPAQPLLGHPRTVDLAMNVILPWLWQRTSTDSESPLRSRIRHRYHTLPSGEDNTVLELARARLFGDSPPRLPAHAAIQQGMLQVVRDFCDHSNAVCSQCRFPDLVRHAARSL